MVQLSKPQPSQPHTDILLSHENTVDKKLAEYYSALSHIYLTETLWETHTHTQNKMQHMHNWLNALCFQPVFPTTM